ncbi:MAG TPA: hypothetical protein VFT62_08350 [Mycobacteriales bacterium]|nr:hypothetical protein [Mycobacteriales bacterium]
MFYVVLFVTVGVATALVLALLSWRLWRQVRQFGRDVAAAGERIARATDELQQLAPPAGRG